MRINRSSYSGILAQDLWMTTKQLITAFRREEIQTKDFPHMRQKCRAFDRDVSMAGVLWERE